MGDTAGRSRLVPERKKRLHKTLRRSGRRSGNLVVYGRPESVQPGERRPSREVPARAPGVPLEQARADPRTVERKATGLERARGRLAAAADPARRMAPALAIVGSMCTGAVVGSLLTRPADDRPAVDDVPLAPESASPPTAAVVAPADATIETVPDGALDRHLGEIDELRARNRDLERQVESLTRETLELNEELLSLEMQIVSLAAPPAPPPEVRLVYNFVNVPIGGSADAYPAPPEPADGGDAGDAYALGESGEEGSYGPGIDAYGNPVDVYRPSIDAYGNPVDADDPGIDTYGNPVDDYGDGGGDGGGETDPEEVGPEPPAPGARSMMR